MKTTDLLTFFQPDESSGTASTFSIQASDGPAIEVWIFARDKVNLSRFANTVVSSDQERASLHQELSSALQPGGGLLVYARPHNEVVKVKLYRVEIAGYTPPKRMLRLSVSGEAQFENITGNADLEIGDHLLLPVNRDAEAKLFALRDNLKGLPSDLESSVLNIIRRPSLEWRMDRIERTLGMPPATRTEQQRSRVKKETLLERLFDSVMRPIPIGPAIAAALILMAGTLFAYEKFSDRHKGTESTNTSPGKVSKNTPNKPSSTPPEPAQIPANRPSSEELGKALSELSITLEKSKNPTARALYTSHLQDLHFWQKGKPTPAFWGIAKLQALQLGIIAGDSKILARPSDQTIVKTIYGKPESSDILTGNDTALNLLGWLTCQGSQKPEFPATESDPDPLPLPTSRTCTDLKAEDAVPGLEALTDWVKEQKEPKK